MSVSHSRALESLRPSAVNQVSRSGGRRVQGEVEDALVAATKIEGTAYITHMAMNHMGILSTIEAQVIHATPGADPIQKEQIARRAALLVDNYVATAATEIARRAV